jgi:hypothetical protein
MKSAAREQNKELLVDPHQEGVEVLKKKPIARVHFLRIK